jgi:hypothetical protein
MFTNGLNKTAGVREFVGKVMGNKKPSRLKELAKKTAKGAGKAGLVIGAYEGGKHLVKKHNEKK